MQVTEGFLVHGLGRSQQVDLAVDVFIPFLAVLREAQELLVGSFSGICLVGWRFFTGRQGSGGRRSVFVGDELGHIPAVAGNDLLAHSQAISRSVIYICHTGSL